MPRLLRGSKGPLATRNGGPVTRPLSVRCAVCRATHASRVYRLKRNPRFWINCKPWHPELYEAEPETIDLTESKICARCTRDLKPTATVRKPIQGKLF